MYLHISYYTEHESTLIFKGKLTFFKPISNDRFLMGFDLKYVQRRKDRYLKEFLEKPGIKKIKSGDKLTTLVFTKLPNYHWWIQ